MVEQRTAPEAAAKLRDSARKAIRQSLRPPPRLSLPDWADTHRRLTRASGAVGGAWQTSRVEVARGPMMAVTEPGVRTITLKIATQLLKTEVLLNTVAFLAHTDPGPILYVLPKDEAVKSFSKERVAPMIEATPALREIMGDQRTRRSDNTVGFKRFPGGFLAIVAAGSPTNLSMRPVRVTLLDEIDKYETTKEGDPVLLAEERSATFTSRRLSIRRLLANLGRDEPDRSVLRRERSAPAFCRVSVLWSLAGSRLFPPCALGEAGRSAFGRDGARRLRAMRRSLDGSAAARGSAGYSVDGRHAPLFAVVRGKTPRARRTDGRHRSERHRDEPDPIPSVDRFAGSPLIPAKVRAARPFISAICCNGAVRHAATPNPRFSNSVSSRSVFARRYSRDTATLRHRSRNLDAMRRKPARQPKPVTASLKASAIHVIVRPTASSCQRCSSPSSRSRLGSSFLRG